MSEQCDAPDFGQVLKQMAHSQGVILRTYLLEERVNAIKVALIELSADHKRISDMIGQKTSELMRIQNELEEQREGDCE